MDRRGFIKLFGAAAAGVALEPAIPFGRVWSFPSKIVIADPAAEAFRRVNQLLDKWESEPIFFETPLKVGDTIRVRMPQRWIIRDAIFFEPFSDRIAQFTITEVHPDYCGLPPTAPPVAQLKSGKLLPDFGIPES